MKSGVLQAIDAWRGECVCRQSQLALALKPIQREVKGTRSVKEGMDDMNVRFVVRRSRS